MKYKSRYLEHSLIFLLIWWFPFDVILIPGEKYSAIDRFSLVFLWGPHLIYILYICKSLEYDNSKYIIKDLFGLRERTFDRDFTRIESKYESSISQCLLLISDSTNVVFYPQGIRKFHEIKNELATKQI